MADGYYFKKMLKATNIESLPDDVILEILVHLSAKDIYDAARLVCPKWYQMARTQDFVHAHLQQSTHGLLIQDKGVQHDRPIFVATRKHRIEISNFNYKFTREVVSSCNGLILETHRSHLYITNPATKQHFAPPPFPTNTTFYNPAITYAATSKEYKVVRTFYNESKSRDECAILTVGVDKDWTRRVNIEDVTLTAKDLLGQSPLATEGFVHWAEKGGKRAKGKTEYVLTLNIETEIITPFRVPLCDGDGFKYYYLSMGSHLSVLIGRRFSWDVWEMKPETGEWKKVTSIHLEARKCMLGCTLKGRKHWLMPVGWSNFGEVLVFSVCDLVHCRDSRHTGFTFAYNVGTHDIESFELDSGLKNFIAHRNSLVWLDGC